MCIRDRLFLSQLNSDLEAIENNGQPSLLGKWLKSENTSSKKSRKLAHKTRIGFNMDSKTYRQTLSRLRRAIRVVEVAMSAKVYDAIEYTKVPSQAMLRYRNAFQRNDRERFSQYLEEVASGRAKINADTLYPQQIVHEISQGNIDSNVADALWNNMPDFTDGIIPKSFSADLLTSPPQCSGLPTSNPSSRTNTEFPFFAISLAVNNPVILPPATIASYMRVMKD
mgnify:CR=1 FL=1